MWITYIIQLRICVSFSLSYISQTNWTGINLFDAVADQSSPTFNYQTTQLHRRIPYRWNWHDRRTHKVSELSFWNLILQQVVSNLQYRDIIHRPLWCLWKSKGEHFGLISCRRGQVGFFEDKSCVSNTKKIFFKMKPWDRRHHEICLSAGEYSVFSVSPYGVLLMLLCVLVHLRLFETLFLQMHLNFTAFFKTKKAEY